MPDIVVVGGGFAGLWAALAATREIEMAGADARVSLVSRDPWLVIRPRLYEAEPERMRVDLRPTLDAVGVRFIAAEVTGFEPAARCVTLREGGLDRALPYDRLVLAAGSILSPFPVEGAAPHAFDIDGYAGAVTLDRHLRGLKARAAVPDTALGAATVVIIGGGFTGIELATEMRSRLAGLWGVTAAALARVVLIEATDRIGPALGDGPRPAIMAALQAAGVEMRLATRVLRIGSDDVLLSSGERIATATTVVTIGPRASPLTELLAGGQLDAQGRLHVDRALRVTGVADVFAAGDVAAAFTDGSHQVMMSCQHALSMGRAAGRNVARDLLGLTIEPYQPPSYVTCLDLGPWGAVFTRGWDREVQMTGAEAKLLKQSINTLRIYPPVGSRAEILAAVVPPPPLSRPLSDPPPPNAVR